MAMYTSEYNSTKLHMKNNAIIFGLNQPVKYGLDLN